VAGTLTPRPRGVAGHTPGVASAAELVAALRARSLEAPHVGHSPASSTAVIAPGLPGAFVVVGEGGADGRTAKPLATSSIVPEPQPPTKVMPSG
jgi:hypothetical protein